MTELLPCPFCNGKAEYIRKGTARYSTAYRCTECGCTLETGETDHSDPQWNNRQPILDAALGAWENISHHPAYSGSGAIGARSGIRDVLVRLGLYGAFNENR